MVLIVTAIDIMGDICVIDCLLCRCVAVMMTWML